MPNIPLSINATVRKMTGFVKKTLNSHTKCTNFAFQMDGSINDPRLPALLVFIRYTNLNNCKDYEFIWSKSIITIMYSKYKIIAKAMYSCF